jgi:hypothetical protein
MWYGTSQRGLEKGYKGVQQGDATFIANVHSSPMVDLPFPTVDLPI